MTKKTFIKGTLILTISGFITRFLGFFHKMILAKAIGAIGIGLYQLVLPIMALCSAVGINGFEVSISKFSASFYRNRKEVKAYAVINMLLSLAISCACGIVALITSNEIAKIIFHNKDCAVLIRYIAISVPFSSIHCIICSYYIGNNKTVIPALSMLFEQLVRIATIFLFYKKITDARLAGICLLTGEIFAAFFCTGLILHRKNTLSSYSFLLEKKYYTAIKKIALPVIANRVFLYGVQTLQIALVPLMLSIYHHSYETALSEFGVFTGMSLPFILFPATLTNAVSQMLLPSVAKDEHNPDRIKKFALCALFFSILFGLVCITFFITIGGEIGALIFHEVNVKKYIKLMSYSCPFIFVSTTYKSILHALGKTTREFVISMLCEIICLIFIISFVPKHGMPAYIAGTLLSQFLNAFLHIRILFKNILNFK